MAYDDKKVKDKSSDIIAKSRPALMRDNILGTPAVSAFADKRPPVNIYAKGTPTVKAQTATTNIATSPIRAALNFGALAPAKAIASTLGDTLDSAQNRVKTDAIAQNRFLNNRGQVAGVDPLAQSAGDKQLGLGGQPSPVIIGRAADREANAMVYGSVGRVVGGNAPGLAVRQALVGNGKVSNIDLSQQASADKQPGLAPNRSTAADAMAYNSANPDPQQPAQQMRDVITNRGSQMVRTQQPVLGQPEQAGSNVRRVLSNRQSTGNLDITFDQGTDQGAIRRFMENPVRPTAQIDRFNANRGADAGQGQRAAMNASRILAGSPGASVSGPPKQFAPSSPSKTWRQAKSTDAKAIANAAERRDYYSGIENSQIDAKNRTDAFSAGANAANAAERNRIDLFGTQGNIANATERNAIDRENIRGSLGIQQGTLDINRQNVTGQNAERAANVKAKDMEIGQSKRLLDLQDAYRKEADPTKKKALENELYAMQGKPQQKGQVVTRKTVDSHGNQIEIPYVLDSEFNAREVGSDQQAQAAPKDPKQRVKGATYLDASGNKIIWDGTGFLRG